MRALISFYRRVVCSSRKFNLREDGRDAIRGRRLVSDADRAKA